MASSPIIHAYPSLSVVSGLAGSGEVSRAQAASAPAALTEGAAGASADDAVSVDTFPSSPPPEVLAAIAGASDAFDALAAKGLHVSFDGDSQSGGLGISLQDQNGSTLAALKPSDVLDLADGNGP